MISAYKIFIKCCCSIHHVYGLKKTSPLPKTGSLPPSPHVSFWGYPPPSPFGETSFMDGPLRKNVIFIAKLRLNYIKMLSLQQKQNEIQSSCHLCDMLLCLIGIISIGVNGIFRNRIRITVKLCISPPENAKKAPQKIFGKI